MRLALDTHLGLTYRSLPQKVRVTTEHWVNESVFCPNCGHFDMQRYESNRPAADFYCRTCREEYELKSKRTGVVGRVPDGAYQTMLQRLTSAHNPNLFLLTYDSPRWEVTDFLVVPRHFFVVGMIEKRKPLTSSARRAGWVGCNILLNQVPDSGKIFFVRDGRIVPTEKVLAEWRRTLFLREQTDDSSRGWLMDVIRCIETLQRREFTLNDVYGLADELQRLHPRNTHVREKIRQQLQVLRDKGFVRFSGKGKYSLAAEQ